MRLHKSCISKRACFYGFLTASSSVSLHFLISAMVLTRSCAIIAACWVCKHVAHIFRTFRSESRRTFFLFFLSSRGGGRRLAAFRSQKPDQTAFQMPSYSLISDFFWFVDKNLWKQTQAAQREGTKAPRVSLVDRMNAIRKSGTLWIASWRSSVLKSLRESEREAPGERENLHLNCTIYISSLLPDAPPSSIYIRKPSEGPLTATGGSCFPSNGFIVDWVESSKSVCIANKQTEITVADCRVVGMQWWEGSMGLTEISAEKSRKVDWKDIQMI